MCKRAALSAQANESTDCRSRITVERGFLTLRWSTEHAPEALESAGMTLQDLLAKHAVPRLEARKGIYIKHRGQITRRLEVEDSDAQLDMAVLLGHVLGMYPGD